MKKIGSGCENRCGFYKIVPNMAFQDSLLFFLVPFYIFMVS